VWRAYVTDMKDRVIVEKSEWKMPLHLVQSRQEEFIDRDAEELWCERVDWIDLAQDRDQR
jgi:hypothetical protein